jgi:DNA polymerase-3 subunit gamma/tau
MRAAAVAPGMVGAGAGDPRAPRAMAAGTETATLAVQAPAMDAPADLPAPQSFEDMVALFAARREGILHAHLVRDVHPVRYEPGRLEFRPTPQAPRDLANRIGQKLGEWTGRRWGISISAEAGQPSIAERQAEAKRRERETVSRHPLVQSVLQHFPGATIEAIRDLAPPAAAAVVEPEPGEAESGDFAVPDSPLPDDSLEPIDDTDNGDNAP